MISSIGYVYKIKDYWVTLRFYNEYNNYTYGIR